MCARDPQPSARVCVWVCVCVVAGAKFLPIVCALPRRSGKRWRTCAWRNACHSQPHRSCARRRRRHPFRIPDGWALCGSTAHGDELLNWASEWEGGQQAGGLLGHWSRTGSPHNVPAKFFYGTCARCARAIRARTRAENYYVLSIIGERVRAVCVESVARAERAASIKLRFMRSACGRPGRGHVHSRRSAERKRERHTHESHPPDH